MRKRDRKIVEEMIQNFIKKENYGYEFIERTKSYYNYEITKHKCVKK